MEKLVLHIDINSCFASCEQQDNPAWRYRPLGVVQDSGKRSVIIASSIEAKALGIGTGASVWEAKKICPSIILAPARFDRYVDYSRRFRKICGDYSNYVETFSIDELFIDLTETAHLYAEERNTASKESLARNGATSIAWRLKRRLREEVGDYLKCSIGIAPNKMLAKLASGSQKPDGLVIVRASEALDFLNSHPLWHICGIGDRVAAHMNRMGIFTITQLRQVPEEYLVREFGIMGSVYHQWAFGEDASEVRGFGERTPDKSYGNQLTLPADVSVSEAQQVLLWLSWQVSARLRRHEMGAKTVSVFVRGGETGGWAQKSGSVCRSPMDIYRMALFLFHEGLSWKLPVRFMGVSASNLVSAAGLTIPVLPKDQKWERISKAWDVLSEKYDPFLLHPARLTGMRLKKTEFNGFSKKF